MDDTNFLFHRNSFASFASLRVPYFTIVLRKGYELGAQAMAAQGHSASAKNSPKQAAAQKALFDKMVAAAYEQPSTWLLFSKSTPCTPAAGLWRA